MACDGHQFPANSAVKTDRLIFHLDEQGKDSSGCPVGGPKGKNLKMKESRLSGVDRKVVVVIFGTNNLPNLLSGIVMLSQSITPPRNTDSA